MGELPQAMADTPVVGDQPRLRLLADIADRADAVAPQAILHRLADPPQIADRPGAEEAQGFGTADDGKATRLVQVRRQLGQELVVAEADGRSDTDLPFDSPGQGHQAPSRADGGGQGGIGQVEERLVDR